MTRSRRLMILAAPLSAPLMLMVVRAPPLPLGLSNDAVGGLIAGLGIGLAIAALAWDRLRALRGC